MCWQKEAVQTPDYCLKLPNSQFLGFGRLDNRNSCPTSSQSLWALGLWICSCKALKGSGQLFCSWLLISQKILSIFGKCEIFCKNSYTSGVKRSPDSSKLLLSLPSHLWPRTQYWVWNPRIFRTLSEESHTCVSVGFSRFGLHSDNFPIFYSWI